MLGHGVVAQPAGQAAGLISHITVCCHSLRCTGEAAGEELLETGVFMSTEFESKGAVWHGFQCSAVGVKMVLPHFFRNSIAMLNF